MVVTLPRVKPSFLVNQRNRVSFRATNDMMVEKKTERHLFRKKKEKEKRGEIIFSPLITNTILNKYENDQIYVMCCELVR